ncbi:MAG: class I SAM-dependent methyltransferase [Rhodospirillaceae bacterium]|jgi:SAM-dependent methyltransferase|nr:class I SAM-dependent methyltransferase [Rhodospirillaceae bacterium]MBT5565478.1 class I SAM-dependent methyltransferase [Rhodospirillaceae bacterium]MBT6089808.1 class I SAM-dependent methyltransferase [Rhodospirillaceae bacterium]MBT6961680.1 class I SAM-dependent methyltransferase [Rhodospirillaceae bacterium]MBT7451129.1 class I SAM-dependent methyltransferase [Rhodospirillaceae bacterium]
MLDRRSLFAATAAVGSFVGAAFGSRKANAATHTSVNLTPKGDVEPRGSKNRLERLPALDLESKYDFVTGFRSWHNKSNRVVSQRVEKILEEKGLDPKAKYSMEKVLPLIEDDHLVGTSGRTWISNQQVTWKILQDYFHEHADEYIAEMEAADNDGPGTLELNPDMEIPKYTKHEIHIQPGGYVGDEFAGHVYHYGTNSFYVGAIGDNEQDQIHIGTANRLPLPEDGVVKRILVQGCGTGQMTSALKERFPDAEVWGIDVGGPMVRYAHMRARNLGLDVNFAQRLAEDTKFPDGYFDIVTSYIINHELPQDSNRAVIAEAHRVTRPGGYYYPVDFRSGGADGRAYGQYRRWWDHRWNTEVWSREYHTLDFDGEIEKAGFTMNRETKAALPGFGARHAVKKA